MWPKQGVVLILYVLSNRGFVNRKQPHLKVYPRSPLVFTACCSTRAKSHAGICWMWISVKLKIITTSKSTPAFHSNLSRVNHVSGSNHFRCHKLLNHHICLLSLHPWSFCRGCVSHWCSRPACVWAASAGSPVGKHSGRLACKHAATPRHTTQDRECYLAGSGGMLLLGRQKVLENTSAWCEALPFPPDIFAPEDPWILPFWGFFFGRFLAFIKI